MSFEERLTSPVFERGEAIAKPASALRSPFGKFCQVGVSLEGDLLFREYDSGFNPNLLQMVK